MKTIGPYTITGTLGEGGMGIVYSAWDERLNRAVALKTLRAPDSDSAATERLRREARAGARVNHPNICQLYDIGSEEGQVYIAMELLEGESLASRLENGRLPLKDAVSIAVSALSALDALHTHGLIHRDPRSPDGHRRACHLDRSTAECRPPPACVARRMGR